jgi:hypothetical protein
MVIVHRERLSFPTCGTGENPISLPLITEYLPKSREFRIAMPEHIAQRVGKEEVRGNTVSDCLMKMKFVLEEFRASFREVRQVRKMIQYTFSYYGRFNRCLFVPRGTFLEFQWDVIYVCQLTTDPLDEAGWIRCDEGGDIRSSSDLKDRVMPGGSRPSHRQGCDCAGYLDWTPEREQFFTDLIERFDRVKAGMFEFFASKSDLEEMHQMIDTGAVPIFSSGDLDA